MSAVLARARARLRDDPAGTTLVAAIGGGGLIGGFFVALTGTPFPLLLIAIMLTTLAFIAPIVWRMRAGACDAFDPIVFAAANFFFPSFIIGGLILAAGLSRPWFHMRIPDVPRGLAAAVGWTALGFLALAAGFAIPLAGRLGSRMARRLPTWEWTARSVAAPSVTLLFAGTALLVLAFSLGLIGYQFQPHVGRFDAFINYGSQSVMVAVFLLWNVIFRLEIPAKWALLVGACLLLLIPVHTWLSASRATPLTHAVALGMAYWFSPRRVRFRNVLAFGVIVVASLASGILYSSSFREAKHDAVVAAVAEPAVAVAPAPVASPTAAAVVAPKVTAPVVTAPPAAAPPAAAPAPAPAPAPVRSPAPSPEPPLGHPTTGEERATLNEQAANAKSALTRILDRGLGDSVSYVFSRMADRLDATSSMAVLTSNYKRLHDEEVRAGTIGNIWRTTWTSFVPRLLWQGKPVTSDSRVIGALYFGFGGNSTLITPTADLLRNYGWLGVVAGMALLGFFLRFVYSSLVVGRATPMWRAAAYFALITRVSYEGFYGTILPDLVRLAMVVAASLLFVEGWRRAVSRRTRHA